MRNDPACLRDTMRLHPMACRCRQCRHTATAQLLGPAKSVLQPFAHSIRRILATPAYDPQRRQFTLLSREPVAVIGIIMPLLILAIGVFLSLEP